MAEKEEKKVNIFYYDDYRKYLQDKFEALKAEKPFFSYRYFSKKAGFASPNFLKLVILGNRNLTKESVLKFSGALGHNQKEHEYFENLVFLNQSKTLKEKNFFLDKLTKNKKFLSIKKLEKLQYDYYSNWYIPVIREMVELKGFVNDPLWISENISPKIKPQEAKKALKVLSELNLIFEEEGRLKKAEHSITTGEEIRNILVRNFHEKMITLGKESIDRFNSKKRDISSLTLSITEQQFKLIKNKIIDFRKEILELATGDEETDLIYQFNFQLFPLIFYETEK